MTWNIIRRSNFHVFLLFFGLITNAQTSLTISPSWGQNRLELNKSYQTAFGDSIQISKLLFYISDIKLLQDTVEIYKTTERFNLINIEDLSSLSIAFDSTINSEYNTLEFNLGIDSIINSQGAWDGPLDPINGMYWAWQSGYINLKLEGTSSSNKDFQFHLGGFLGPYYSIQNVSIFIMPKEVLNLELNLDPFFDKTDLDESNHIMSPSSKTVELSAYIASLFTTKR